VLAHQPSLLLRILTQSSRLIHNHPPFICIVYDFYGARWRIIIADSFLLGGTHG
jgi:hypothetical protein